MDAIKPDLLDIVGKRRFGTILADPPWQFTNKTGKVAPEHRRLSRYGTMTLDEIMALPVERLAAPTAHLYLWCPNALLPDGLAVMKAWGFSYKSNIVWHKVRKDGGSDGRGVGFYFRNVTELLLFGVRGKNARTLAPGRRQRESAGDAQARALAQARRAIRGHRGVQPRAIPRAIRARHA
jgi:N6-adenosine-specific RNA methylase IME4